MEEGKFLGHIISNDDIRIDASRIEEIKNLDYPRSKSKIQSYNGKINFLRRLFSNIVEHLREIIDMFKKDSEVKWSDEANKSFNQVKFVLSHAHILIISDYTLDFIILSFASKHNLVVVLVQKKYQKTE